MSCTHTSWFNAISPGEPGFASCPTVPESGRMTGTNFLRGQMSLLMPATEITYWALFTPHRHIMTVVRRTRSTVHDAHTGHIDVLRQPIEKCVADELREEKTQRKFNNSLQRNHSHTLLTQLCGYPSENATLLHQYFLVHLSARVEHQ